MKPENSIRFKENVEESNNTDKQLLRENEDRLDSLMQTLIENLLNSKDLDELCEDLITVCLNNRDAEIFETINDYYKSKKDIFEKVLEHEDIINATILYEFISVKIIEKIIEKKGNNNDEIDEIIKIFEKIKKSTETNINNDNNLKIFTNTLKNNLDGRIMKLKTGLYTTQEII